MKQKQTVIEIFFDNKEYTMYAWIDATVLSIKHKNLEFELHLRVLSSAPFANILVLKNQECHRYLELSFFT